MPRSPTLFALFFGVAAGIASAAAPASQPSALWGREGEVWSAESRLPDFSFAGYRRGEAEIPTPPVTHDLKRDFGAVGDGVADDTEAFVRAVKEVKGGVILIPNGRYRITRIVEIARPHLVFRGESRDGAVLFFPKPLNDVQPDWGATTGGQRTSNYSWSGGYLWVKGTYRTRKLAEVAARTPRGSRMLELATPAGLAVGQEVDIRQQDTADNSLARHLYTEQPGDISQLRARTRTTFVARIVAIQGRTITLDRPLRCDLRPEWQPTVNAFEPSVTETGIENLTFEFPVTDYRGHFTELGFNPIAFSSVAHCWVRNVRLFNPDNGPFIAGRFCTVEGVVYESKRKPDRQRYSTGHHGLSFHDCDNLFTRFDFRMQFQHDVTMGAGAAGNVVAEGRGVDLCFDHHRRAPYENLFTHVDVGAGTHPWRCGGGDGLGLHAGARTTFWNIRSARALSHPGSQYGPASINVVGITTTSRAQREPAGIWFETVPPAELWPQNLHAAQKTRRLAPRGD